MTLQDLISARTFVLGSDGPSSSSSSSYGDDGMVGGPGGHQGDIHGLPAYLRSGLIAIAFFGFLSLVSATGLFAYISYRLLRWHYFFKHQKERRRSLGALEAHCNHARPTQSDIPDYTLGLPQLNPPSAAAHYVGFQPQPHNQMHFQTAQAQTRSQSRSRSPSPCPSFSDYHNQYEQYQQHPDSAASTVHDAKGKKKHKRHASGSSTQTTATTASSSLAAEVATNPFLLLIYNLLLADIIQAASFLLSVVWIRYDGTYSGSVTCWLQGWLAMTGKLSASACLVFASGLTYLTVVRGYRASPRALYCSIAVVWLLTYVLAGAGVAITHNGRRGGGWFAWSNGWCWVSPFYREQRFWLGYFWIFLSVGLTILIYGAIFVTMLRRKKLSWRHMPDLESDRQSQLSSSQLSQRSQSQSQYQLRRPSQAQGGGQHQHRRRKAPRNPRATTPCFWSTPSSTS
ncbi:G-protein coupled receptor [Apiospora rasikravindrae]|uniref:G-protein coupled receptor n=1 Tax=Apiospora rasikravindrae TaxID=990691 RepID=A0ABR1RQS1_9PEZI